MPIFGEAKVHIRNQSRKKVRVLPRYDRKCTQLVAKKVMYLKKNQRLGEKNCLFLAHIYATNYQDHFIILSSAL